MSLRQEEEDDSAPPSQATQLPKVNAQQISLISYVQITFLIL